ncbi:hypothetical protein [Streptomyces anandii]|uniref:hypothetical protein n=1 Tax=Streptomyces anandii TaxID=285454 RepID=UPI00167A7CB7|nr:hypothetical protein [Streptomyces anandii]GGY10555.1 hypothetical protein GCM10010510_65610 [Streptomyces anandii JCM 4720]
MSRAVFGAKARRQQRTSRAVQHHGGREAVDPSEPSFGLEYRVVQRGIGAALPQQDRTGVTAVTAVQAMRRRGLVGEPVTGVRRGLLACTSSSGAGSAKPAQSSTRITTVERRSR